MKRYRYMTYEEALKFYKNNYATSPYKAFEGWGKEVKNVVIDGEYFSGDIVGFRHIKRGNPQLLICYRERDMEIE